MRRSNANLKRRCTVGTRFLVAVAAVLATALVSAQTNERAPAINLNEVQRGSLLIEDEPGRESVAVPLVDTDVGMTIRGLIARVTVRQTFEHRGEKWVNGIYAFPLPELAAVDRLRMHVGERVIEGLIEERKKARRRFDEARREGKKASLVEQQRPNLFTTSVANIGPRETIVVEIEYQQTIDYRDGWFSLRFPMTIGVRYIPGTSTVAGFDGGGWSFNTDLVPDASSVTPPVTSDGVGHSNPVRIQVDLDLGVPLAAIESPYHAVNSNSRSSTRYQVELAAAEAVADRDFELRFRAAGTRQPQAAFFRQQAPTGDYGLLMVLPPDLKWSKSSATARELVFVVDTSGSMHGTSIDQAREALRFGLSRLKPGDTFNIVQFNSTTHAFAPVALSATPQNLLRAEHYIGRLKADGGTEMANALEHVLDGSENHERLRQIVFMTDGSVGNEAHLFEIIDQRLGAARLFTVGIGSAPNAHFMREAASVGRGTYTYVGSITEVARRMSELFQKLEFPVLTGLGLHVDGELEYWPQPIGDLYVHEPLMVSLKLKDQSKIGITGRFRGKSWKTSVPISAGATATGLDVAWARQKIASLERSLARGANRDTVRAEITALGLRHHLVTAHTSLVAVDVTPSLPRGDSAEDGLVANKLPHGWRMTAPGHRLPQTATPLALNLLLGLVALLGAGLSRCRRPVR